MQQLDEESDEDDIVAIILRYLIPLWVLGGGSESDEWIQNKQAEIREHASVIAERLQRGVDPSGTIARITGDLHGVYSRSFALHGMEAEKEYRWVVDPAKENCSTCLEQQASGPQPASVWAERARNGIYPGSPQLACGGYHCGCSYQ